MKLAWLTDIHLEFLKGDALQNFFEAVENTSADAVAITGDIGTADRLGHWLERMSAAWSIPIYFVLGNHDYYHGSITETRREVKTLAATDDRLFWMGADPCPVALSDKTTLVGHGGFGDARLGDVLGTTVRLNDMLLIKDFLGHRYPDALRPLLARYADEAAEHIRVALERACAMPQPDIFVLTHVPPFREACWHEGHIPKSDDGWLPFFASKATGDVLLDVAARYPHKKITTLCGHTHGAGEVMMLDNLHVSTGGAVYGSPEVVNIIEV